MKKLLRHLTNVPVAVALAFLLVGAPSAPMVDWMPSSGDAMATGPGATGNAPNTGGSSGCQTTIVVPIGDHWVVDHVGGDMDCDGIMDAADPCPSDPQNKCEANCDRKRAEQVSMTAKIVAAITAVLSFHAVGRFLRWLQRTVAAAVGTWIGAETGCPG